MSTKYFDIVGFKGVSVIDSSFAFGHKSALDLAGASYSQFAFATSSFSYDTSTWTTVAHVVTGINSLLNDMNKKGIIVKS